LACARNLERSSRDTRQTWGIEREAIEREAIKNRTGPNAGSRFVIGSSRKRLASLGVFSVLVAATVLIPGNAEASSNCGTPTAIPSV
jgi:hypothetical protein